MAPLSAKEIEGCCLLPHIARIDFEGKQDHLMRTGHVSLKRL
jgi:hypothetical protein